MKESRSSLDKFKQNNKGEDKRTCYYNPELIKNSYTKIITAFPKQENLELIWVQKVWKHFHSLE